MSQNKIHKAASDAKLRSELKSLIKAYNSHKVDGKELHFVDPASNNAHMMMRAVRSGAVALNRPAHPNTVEPRSRCVEMALIEKLREDASVHELSDISLTTTGNILWQEPLESDEVPAKLHSSPHESFKKGDKPQADRLTSYLHGEKDMRHVHVPLAEGKKGYLDIWTPCTEHCSPYFKSMMAFAIAGSEVKF